MAQERTPRARVADCDAVIDERAAVALRVPARHREGPDLELERRGHAVVRIVSVALGILPVGMEVDEAGGDHEPRDVQRLARGGELGGDGPAPAARGPYLEARVCTQLSVQTVYT